MITAQSKVNSADCPRPGGSKSRPHPFHETTCLLGRIYPREFCAWSHSSRAQQRHIDTFPTYRAISQYDHPQNGVCPLLLSSSQSFSLLFSCAWLQSSVWSQCDLWGSYLGGWWTGDIFFSIMGFPVYMSIAEGIYSEPTVCGGFFW